MTVGVLTSHYMLLTNLPTPFTGSQARLTLRGDHAVLSYSGVGRSQSVSRVHDFLEKMTAAIGGNFIANPAWSLLGQQEITVHPMCVGPLNSTRKSRHERC